MLEKLKYRHKVILSNTARLLKINGIRDLLVFTKLYTRSNKQYVRTPREIDWNILHSEFEGIIISPYLEHYLEHDRYSSSTMWYTLSWECAGLGCIWNSKAIEKLELDESYEVDFEREATREVY